jgi:FkbM family methyltransferase
LIGVVVAFLPNPIARRAALRLYPAVPERAVLRIVAGPLRGRRWIPKASIANCWLGSSAPEVQKSLRRLAGPGSVVFDVGAHAGFVTLCAAQIVDGGGRVVAFEPLPANLENLRRHVELNDLRNVDVLPYALAAVAGTARFDVGGDLSTGHLADGGNVEVETVSLDGLLASGDVPPPDVVKIDVEGAEADVLTGAARLLGVRRPALILATHGADRHAACLELLAGHGYRVHVIRETPLAGADFRADLVAEPAS